MIAIRSFTRRILFAFSLSFVLAPLIRAGSAEEVERGQWEEILKLVAKDAEKNFYDPQMKGLDWTALTDQADQKIRSAKNTAQMIMAIEWLLDQLQDSGTGFIPPRLTLQVNYGFKVKAYGDKVFIYELTPKEAGAKAGLHNGDQVLAINGVPVDREDIRPLWRLVTFLVPEKALEMTVLRGNDQITIHVPAKVQSVMEWQYTSDVWRVADAARARDWHVDYKHEERDGVGYLKIPSLYPRTADEILFELNRVAHAKALILDLREDTGGTTANLLAFLGFFEKNSEVLAKRVTRAASSEMRIDPISSDFNGKIFVLTDSKSGGAAELAAWHLRKNNGAIVIGDRTSGSVTEGRVFPESVGAGYVMYFGSAIATSLLQMPDGTVLEGKGVAPDVPCVPSQEDLQKGNDPCKEKAFSLAAKN